MRGKEQLLLQEEVEISRIASVRIHVERAIERIKNYCVLQGVIPLSVHAQLDHIWFICCFNKFSFISCSMKIMNCIFKIFIINRI